MSQEKKQLEIKQKREYIRLLNTKLFKLNSQIKSLKWKMEQAEKEIKNHEKEKKLTEKWLEKNG
jgi:septal ring factor EnvC (AmiA/AmiB activator)